MSKPTKIKHPTSVDQPFGTCPICDKSFPMNEIENHVNKCIFLNSVEERPTLTHNASNSTQSFDDTKQKPLAKRRRSPSPILPCNRASLYRNNNESPVQQKTQKNEPSPQTLDFSVPLAKQLQPTTLDTFIGQDHVLGPDSILRTLLERTEIPNMILWGPPGCGKTSLASVVQRICTGAPQHWRFVTMCATSTGVKDVQEAIEAAVGRKKFAPQMRTVLFMDEIHRFNKRQQDTFLLHVERGDVVLIGATTENPSFALNSALLSRCRVVVFEKLTSDSLYEILQRASARCNVKVVDDTEGEVFGDSCDENDDNKNAVKAQISMFRSALKWLADISDGDARIALMNLQLVVQYGGGASVITVDDVKEKIQKSHMLYDRKGEEHYNVISAMHKSIRGSDANAALYWTTRMIVSGEDPMFIARRLVRAASEDIGNADPNALQLAVSTMQGCQLLGMPESDVLLAQCAIYLARAPKSREADTAVSRAKALIANCKGAQPGVPLHIRNAPTRLMKDLGYGKFRGAPEDYGFMPPEIKDVDFFN